MTPPAEASGLRSELLKRFRAGADTPLDDDEFDRLARAAFTHQFATNRAYRAYCDRRGAVPVAVRYWTEIPAVPTSAFKAIPLVSGDPAGVVRVFRTSGTTAGQERRGEHHLLELELYDAALRAGFAAHLLPDGARLPVLSLIPSASTMADSSLAYMADTVMQDFGAAGSGGFVGAGGVEVARLNDALARSGSDGTPVCILATSLALAHLLDELAREERGYSLPPGSRVMDTGGFKGRARQLSRAELYARVEDRLGIGAAWCVNEYGMTEMGSQFYDARAGEPEAAEVEERRYRGPGWVRTRAVDPESLEILPDGETGILRHWDLANLHSVMALQTEDLGVCEGGEFRLLGRATDAEPRGCSLATEELLAALGRG